MAITARTSQISAAIVCGLMLFSVGCKSKAPDDTTLASTVQTAINADTALTGQPIQALVADGVVTLNGTVSNDAQRTLAARDAAAIPGIAKVVNSITVGPAAPVTAEAVAPPPIPAPAQPSAALVKPAKPTPQLPAKPVRQPAPIERPQPAYNPPPPQQPVEPAHVAEVTPIPPPPAPPKPTFRDVTLDTSNSIPVRITETLDSASTQPDTNFTGVVASDIIIDGFVVIPAGSPISGHVDVVHEAAHFKGSSLITISLVSVTRRGDRIAVSTEPYTVQGKGRGANTAEKTGGGAAVGAILGGIFGGGKGAAIGAGAGAAVGAGANGVTRGQQVQIASESVVRFRLTAPLTVRVRTDQGDRKDGSGLNIH